METSSSSSSSSSSSQQQQQQGSATVSITTAIRIRPLNRSDGDRKGLGQFVFKDYGVKGGLVALDPSFYHRYPSEDRRMAMQTGTHTAYERRFNFDFSFENNEDQSEVYRQCGRPLLTHFLDGYNCCLIAYGQTGSGKTYTMIGADFVDSSAAIGIDDGELAPPPPPLLPSSSSSSSTSDGHHFTPISPDVGVIPRLCGDLFKTRDDLLRSNASKFKRLDVFISFYEIYNEKVYDLLSLESEGIDRNSNDKSKSKSTTTDKGNESSNSSSSSSSTKDMIGRMAIVRRIRESPDTGAYIENLSKRPLANISDFQLVLRSGMAARSTAATLLNANSSRSHAVFTIYLEQEVRSGEDMSSSSGDGDSGSSRSVVASSVVKRSSRVNLIDLAGSERASYTGAAGERLTEANNINRSLASLGDVIKALSSGRLHVPYRNSVLTWLLKDSLSGNSKTSMIATISPSDMFYKESLTTLRYIERVKHITTRAVVNETNDNSSIQAQLIRLQQDLHQAVEEAEKQKAISAAETADHLIKVEELRGFIHKHQALIDEYAEQLEEKDNQQKSSVARYKDIITNHKKEKSLIEAQNAELMIQMKRLSLELEHERTLSADRATEIRILKSGNASAATFASGSSSISSSDGLRQATSDNSCKSTSNTRDAGSVGSLGSVGSDESKMLEMSVELELLRGRLARQSEEGLKVEAALQGLRSDFERSDRAIAAAAVAGSCLSGLLRQIDGISSSEYPEADIANLIDYLHTQMHSYKKADSGSGSGNGSEQESLPSPPLPAVEFEPTGLLESIISSEYKRTGEDKVSKILSELHEASSSVRLQMRLKSQSARVIKRITDENGELSKQLEFLKANGQRAINIVADRYNQELRYISDMLSMESEDFQSELLRYSQSSTQKFQAGRVGNNSVNSVNSLNNNNNSSSKKSKVSTSKPRQPKTNQLTVSSPSKKLIFDMFPEMYENEQCATRSPDLSQTASDKGSSSSSSSSSISSSSSSKVSKGDVSQDAAAIDSNTSKDDKADSSRPSDHVNVNANAKNNGDDNDDNDDNDDDVNEVHDENDNDNKEDANGKDRLRSRSLNKEVVELLLNRGGAIEKDDLSSVDKGDNDNDDDDDDDDNDDDNDDNNNEAKEEEDVNSGSELDNSTTSINGGKSRRNDHSLYTMRQDLVQAKLSYATLSQTHEEVQLELIKSEKLNKQYEAMIGDLKLKIATLTAEIDDKLAFIEILRQKMANRV